MKILVCGGRNYEGQRDVYDLLDGYNGEDRRVSLIVTGGATGTDAIADQWARNRGVNRTIFPANWDGEGRAAGPKRNGRMLQFIKPDLVLAFPGGRGTANMVEQAKRAGIEVQEWAGQAE